jgi:L-lactate dehydrogenase
MVLGEHGDSQVPIYSHTTLNEKVISEFPTFDQELLEKAKELTRTAAFQIRETQTGTTYGVAKCGLKIMQDLLGDEKHDYPISVLTNEHYINLLKIDHPIFISVPVAVSKNNMSVRNLDDFTNDELEAYRRSARVLSDIIL